MSTVRFGCPDCGWSVARADDDTDVLALKATRCAPACERALAYEYRELPVAED